MYLGPDNIQQFSVRQFWKVLGAKSTHSRLNDVSSSRRSALEVAVPTSQSGWT